MPSIARIETERLLLREHRDTDNAAWGALIVDPDFRRYVPARRSDEAPEVRANRSLSNMMKRWNTDPLRAVGWVIARRSDGAIIGTVGVDEAEAGDGELDYFLGKPFWGQGYGREAAHAAARFALDRIPYRRLVAYIVPANLGSVRIAEGLGMRFEREVDYLQFFPDPSEVELADPMTAMYAADRKDVTLGAGPYRVIEGDSDGARPTDAPS